MGVDGCILRKVFHSLTTNLSLSLMSPWGPPSSSSGAGVPERVLCPPVAWLQAGTAAKGNKMPKQYRGASEESRKSPSRRTFLQQIVGTGLASAAGVTLLPRMSLAGKGGTTPPPPQGTGQQPGKDGQPVAGAQGGDLDVLNFALLLER